MIRVPRPKLGTPLRVNDPLTPLRGANFAQGTETIGPTAPNRKLQLLPLDLCSPSRLGRYVSTSDSQNTCCGLHGIKHCKATNKGLLTDNTAVQPAPARLAQLSVGRGGHRCLPAERSHAAVTFLPREPALDLRSGPYNVYGARGGPNSRDDLWRGRWIVSPHLSPEQCCSCPQSGTGTQPESESRVVATANFCKLICCF